MQRIQHQDEFAAIHLDTGPICRSPATKVPGGTVTRLLPPTTTLRNPVGNPADQWEASFHCPDVFRHVVVCACRWNSPKAVTRTVRRTGLGLVRREENSHVRLTENSMRQLGIATLAIATLPVLTR